MQSLSYTYTTATAVQNPSVCKLHVFKVRHSKKTPTQRTGRSGQRKHKSCYCCETTPSQPKKDCLAKDAEYYKCAKMGHSKSSCKSMKNEKDMGKLKDMRKSKPTNVHELSVQAVVGPCTQQQFAAPYQQTTYYNPSPRSEIPKVPFTVCR